MLFTSSKKKYKLRFNGVSFFPSFKYIFLSDMENNFIPYPYLLRELDFFTDPLFNAHLFIFIISLWCMLFDPTTIFSIIYKSR